MTKRIIAGFVSTKDFLDLVKRDPQIHAFRNEVGRIPAGAVEPEKIENVFANMEHTAGKYMEWEDVISFFSQKGYT